MGELARRGRRREVRGHVRGREHFVFGDASQGWRGTQQRVEAGRRVM
jgi:hypothetical protein